MDGITPLLRAPVGQFVGISETGQPLDFRPRKIWARIGTSRSGNKYSWSPAYLNDDGTLTVVTDGTGGEVIQGTTTDFPAVEVSGSTSVPPNSIQELVASERGPWFEFRQGGGGGKMRFLLNDFLCDSAGQQFPIYDLENATTIPVSGLVSISGTSQADVQITGSVNTPGEEFVSGNLVKTGSDGKYSSQVSPYYEVDGDGIKRWYVTVGAGSGYTPNPAKIAIAPTLPTAITQNFTG
jgi:hypothetical protein